MELLKKISPILDLDDEAKAITQSNLLTHTNNLVMWCAVQLLAHNVVLRRLESAHQTFSCRASGQLLLSADSSKQL
jgi:hypothetical protein